MSERYETAAWLTGAIADALRAGHAAEPGVQEVLTRLAEQDLQRRLSPPVQSQRACRHLPDVTGAALMTAPAVAAALAAAEDELNWVQNPGYRSDPISDDYCYCELIGPQGFFAGDDFLLGLMIIGPDRIYRDHFHKAPELYWLLTGPTDWSHGRGPYQAFEAGDTLWHEPNVLHATRTLHAPLLAVWAWTRDVDEPARFA